jgi:hypothetical protein
MIEHKVEQGTPEWHKLRIGRITSSRVADIMKSDNLKVVDALIYERSCPDDALWDTQDGYVSDAMQWGTDHEDDAVQAYTAKTGNQMEAVGFCTHKVFDYLGMSPDRLTPDRTGAVEVKCPNTKTHIRTIRMGGLPNEHKYQVLQYFLINEDMQWLDFVSYDPRFAPRPLYIHRITRDEVQVELGELMASIVKFWTKFEKYYQQVTF